MISMHYKRIFHNDHYATCPRGGEMRVIQAEGVGVKNRAPTLSRGVSLTTFPQTASPKNFSPRGVFRGDDPDYPAFTADVYHEPENPTFTGLYDADGAELHRVPQPFGFVGKRR